MLEPRSCAAVLALLTPEFARTQDGTLLSATCPENGGVLRGAVGERTLYSAPLRVIRITRGTEVLCGFCSARADTPVRNPADHRQLLAGPRPPLATP